MKLKEKIMIERLSKLSELEPAEQEEVLRDPQLQAALVENRLLGERVADAPPAPRLEATLSQALSRPQREDRTMSVRTLFAGKKWYAQAAIAAVLLAVIAVAAMLWYNNQASADFAVRPADNSGPSYRVAQSLATEVEPGLFEARCNINGIRAMSADGKDLRLTLAFNITSTLAAEDSLAYTRELERYDREFAEYERKLKEYNDNQAALPTGLILAGGRDFAGEGGGRVVAKPSPPRSPQVPMTKLARAMHDDAEGIATAVAGIVATMNAGGIDTPEFCRKVKDNLSPRYDAGLGSIDSVEVTYLRIM